MDLALMLWVRRQKHFVILHLIDVSPTLLLFEIQVLMCLWSPEMKLKRKKNVKPNSNVVEPYVYYFEVFFFCLSSFALYTAIRYVCQLYHRSTTLTVGMVFYFLFLLDGCSISYLELFAAVAFLFSIPLVRSSPLLCFFSFIIIIEMKYYHYYYDFIHGILFDSYKYHISTYVCSNVAVSFHHKNRQMDSFSASFSHLHEFQFLFFYTVVFIS